MFKDANSLIVVVGNTSINIGDYATSIKYQYPKLWGQDSGRNLKGVMTGTLLGIFPKIIVNFRKLTRTELENITPILDSATQSVTYYDVRKKQSITISTYTGDWDIENRNIDENKPFSISFIARSKR